LAGGGRRSHRKGKQERRGPGGKCEYEVRSQEEEKSKEKKKKKMDRGKK